MLDVKAVVFLFSLAIISEAAVLDIIKPCRLIDNECQRVLYQKVINSIGRTGIEELGIPPIDPIELKNVSVSVLGLMEIGLVDGVAVGAKDCVLNSLVTNIERRSLTTEVTCDITVKGHYKALANSPIVKSLFGPTGIHADGNGKVKLEKLHIKFEHSLRVYKGEDGEVFIVRRKNGSTFNFKILGRIAFSGDGIFLGNQDVSTLIVGILNDNGKLFMESFGKPFISKALEYIEEFTGKFFSTVPAKYFYIDDLSQYVEN